MAWCHRMAAATQSWLRSPCAVVLLLGAWFDGIYGERPVAPADAHASVLLQLHHRGNLASHRHSHTATSLAASEPRAHGDGPEGEDAGTTDTKTGENNVDPAWAAIPRYGGSVHVSEAVDKYIESVDAWNNNRVQKDLTKLAADAYWKSKAYNEMGPEFQKGINNIAHLDEKTWSATKDMERKELDDIDVAAQGAKSKAVVPNIPDRFPVPRPGSKVQFGDDWKPTEEMEDYEDTAHRLKDELAVAKADADKYKHLLEVEKAKNAGGELEQNAAPVPPDNREAVMQDTNSKATGTGQ